MIFANSISPPWHLSVGYQIVNSQDRCICELDTKHASYDPDICLLISLAPEVKALNAELLAALEELLLGYDEETGFIDVSLEPHCQECARHQARAVIAKAKELEL
jgi:hypothetical protein